MSKYLIFVLAVFFAAKPLLGQPTLSMDYSIRIAQEQSPSAKAARFQYEGEQWDYRSFRSTLLPRLDFTTSNTNYQRAINPITLDDGTIGFVTQQQGSITGNLNLSQNIIPTGGQVFLSSSLNRTSIYGRNETWNTNWATTPLSIGFSQPINQFNRFKWDVEIRPLQLRISNKEFVQEMENVALNTVRRFFDVFLAQANVEINGFNKSINDSIYNVSIGRYQVGKIAENELLQSELAKMNAEGRLNASLIEYQRNLNDFKIFLGYPTDYQLELSDAPPSFFVEIDVQKAIALAKENNSQYLDFLLQELQAERDLDQARRANALQANLQGSFGLNQTAAEFSQVYEDPQNRTFVSMGINVPILAWGQQTADIKSAKARQQSVENQIMLQTRQFEQNVAYQIQLLEQLAFQVELAAKSDTIAQKRYDVTKNRYLIGKVDITNLQIAQNEKDAARQGYVSALRQFWTAWYEIRRLTLWDFKKDEAITYEL